MDLVVDFEKTFGEINFLGKEEKEVTKPTSDGGFTKTGEKFYKYTLASEVTGKDIVVKCDQEHEFKRFEPVKLVNGTVKPYVQNSGNFSMVNFSIKADDITSAGASSVDSVASSKSQNK
ncbi:DUF961 domain-containing protein [Staphylococcus xylosus]|uniref:DUF961 family protein n=1 Tax=Staphylococcus xylosus TaxID=1288 RepID=UPI0010716B79|nr:DUF961 family protein [Staphylococcus xylosus]MBF0812021.1 DUF961 family protein [Staphylococcus xylosus]TFV19887.1 DUF961 domain-containing protein [Staphylococcus xylosus]